MQRSLSFIPYCDRTLGACLYSQTLQFILDNPSTNDYKEITTGYFRRVNFSWGNNMKNLSKKWFLPAVLVGIYLQAGAVETSGFHASKGHSSEVNFYTNSSRTYYSVVCSNGWNSNFYQTEENSCSKYTNGTQTYETPRACAKKQNNPPFNELREALNQEVGNSFCAIERPEVAWKSTKTVGVYWREITCVNGGRSVFHGEDHSILGWVYTNRLQTFPYNDGKFDERVSKPFCKSGPPPAPSHETVHVNSPMTWLKMNEHTYSSSYEEAQNFCESEMNNNAFLGSARWRLPTLQELLSLRGTLKKLSPENYEKRLTEFGLSGPYYNNLEEAIWAQPYQEPADIEKHVFNLAGTWFVSCYKGDNQPICKEKHKVVCVKDSKDQ